MPQPIRGQRGAWREARQGTGTGRPTAPTGLAESAPAVRPVGIGRGPSASEENRPRVGRARDCRARSERHSRLVVVVASGFLVAERHGRGLHPVVSERCLYRLSRSARRAWPRRSGCRQRAGCRRRRRTSAGRTLAQATGFGCRRGLTGSSSGTRPSPRPADRRRRCTATATDTTRRSAPPAPGNLCTAQWMPFHHPAIGNNSRGLKESPTATHEVGKLHDTLTNSSNSPDSTFGLPALGGCRLRQRCPSHRHASGKDQVRPPTARHAEADLHDTSLRCSYPPLGA
jgi:hypothetical protein